MTNVQEPHRSHELAAIAALAALSAHYNAMMLDNESAYWMLVVRECVDSAEMHSRFAARIEASGRSVFPGVRS